MRVWLGCNKLEDEADTEGELDVRERQVRVGEGKDAPAGETEGSEDNGGAEQGPSAAEGGRHVKRMLDMLKQCMTLLQKLMQHKHGWVFNVGCGEAGVA
jgi:hypothetical protein